MPQSIMSASQAVSDERSRVNAPCLARSPIRRVRFAKHNGEPICRPRKRWPIDARSRRPFCLPSPRPYLGARRFAPAARGRRGRARGQLGDMPVTNTIALVDDDRNILTSVSMALEAEGFAVRCYSDGAEALKGMTAQPVDLAVLDIKMPRMDGMELLGQLRQQSHDPGDLPDLEGRRGRRAARPAHGRRRLHQEAVFAAAADRAHPGADPARRAGARARRRARRAGHRARPDDPRPGTASVHLAAASRSS